MEGPQKFIDWLLEMGYLEQDDIPTDKKEIIADIRKVRTVCTEVLQHDDVYVQLRRLYAQGERRGETSSEMPCYGVRQSGFG